MYMFRHGGGDPQGSYVRTLEHKHQSINSMSIIEIFKTLKMQTIKCEIIALLTLC